MNGKMSMNRKNCNTCVNLVYDEERAHYRCWWTNKVIYDAEKETCEEWGAYVPATIKPSDVTLTLTQSEIKIK